MNIARKLALVAVMVLASLTVLVEPAMAKGPVQVVITGPAIAPITVTAAGKKSAADLESLRDGSGIIDALYLAKVETTQPPEGDPGPRYRLSWAVPASPQGATVVQDLYPYAHCGAWTFTPKQPHVLGSGWHKAPAELNDTLTALGLPPRPAPSASPERSDSAASLAPASAVDRSGGSDGRRLGAMAAVAGALVLTTLAVGWIRRRRT